MVPSSDAQGGAVGQHHALELGDDVAALIARKFRDEGRVQWKASRVTLRSSPRAVEPEVEVGAYVQRIAMYRRRRRWHGR